MEPQVRIIQADSDEETETSYSLESDTTETSPETSPDTDYEDDFYDEDVDPEFEAEILNLPLSETGEQHPHTSWTDVEEPRSQSPTPGLSEPSGSIPTGSQSPFPTVPGLTTVSPVSPTEVITTPLTSEIGEVIDEEVEEDEMEIEKEMGIKFEIQGNLLIMRYPEGTLDQYQEYFSNIGGRYLPNLATRFGDTYSGVPGWTFTKRNRDRVKNLIDQILSGQLPPPDQLPSFDASALTIDPNSAGQVPEAERVLPVTSEGELSGQVRQTQIVEIPLTPVVEQVSRGRGRGRGRGTARGTAPGSRLPTGQGIGQVAPPSVQIASMSTQPVDPDRLLAEQYIQRGGSVNQKYDRVAILNADPSEIQVFIMLFGLPQDDNVQIRQRIVKILGYLGAINTEIDIPSTESTVLPPAPGFGGPAELETPINVPPAGDLAEIQTGANLLGLQQVGGELQVTPIPEIKPRQIPNYEPTDKEPGESDTEYQRRLQIYQGLIGQGLSSEQADLLSRMRNNVDFDGVQYDPYSMQTLATYLPLK